MTRRRVAALAAGAALLLASASLPLVPAAAQTAYVTPFVDCVTVSGTTATAYFGYVNITNTVQDIPQGPNNFFLQAPRFRNQPGAFQPGQFHLVFGATFDPALGLAWLLDGEYALATANSPRCGPGLTLRVTPDTTGATATYAGSFLMPGDQPPGGLQLIAASGTQFPGNPADYAIAGATVTSVATGSPANSVTVQATGTGFGPGEQVTLAVYGVTNGSVASPDQTFTVTPTYGTSLGSIPVTGTYGLYAPQLTFLREPAGAQSGASIGTVTAALEDPFGNIVTTDSTDMVTLALTAPGGAQLTGTTTQKLRDGIATFSGLSVNLAGSYTLTATDPAAASGRSAPFAITPGPATRLAFLVQPGGAAAGSALGPQPQVAIEDAAGNVVSTDASQVSLALAGGTAGATLSGPAAVHASAGVAVFSGLAVNRAGSGYTLTAAAGSLVSATSQPFTVSAGAPASVVLQAPASITVGGTATVTGAVYDAEGDGVPNAAVDLTATAAGGGPAGTLDPTVTADVYGDFQVTYAAPAIAGSVTLAAASGAAGASDALQVAPAGAPEAVSLDLSPAVAGGGVQAKVSGTVVGPGGQPLPHALVDLSATADGFPGDSVSASVYAAGAGTWSTPFTAPATAGPVLVTATVPSLGVSTAAVLMVASASGQAGASSTAFAVAPGGALAGGAGSATPELTATAGGGTGGVAVLEYGSDPAGTVAGGPAQGAGQFFDAAITPPAAGSPAFQDVTLEDCGLPGPAKAYWWSAVAGTWQTAYPQATARQASGAYCLYVGPLDATGTSPSLAELTGTPFAVAATLAAGDTLTWQPSPLAPAGSLGAGQTVKAAVTAAGPSGGPIAGATVYLAFVPAAGGGAAAVGGTALTATPAAFTTGANGQVAVTYTAPATLPSGGTDTLTAAGAASGATRTATDTYTFATGSGSGTVTATGSGSSAPPAPTVSGISPASGPAAGGTAVTISGSGFTTVTAVDFGSTPAAGFTVTSDTEIAAVAPAGGAGTTVDVTVAAAGGVSATSGADRFAYAVATAQAVPTTEFADVPPSYWAHAEIDALAAAGVVNGFPDGSFRPDAAVTRAQFVKMLDLTLGLAPSSAPTPFTDVPADAWYAPSVSAALRAGIVRGISPTAFGPDQPLTREEMAVMLARALRLSGGASLTFTDAGAIGAWAAPGVEAAVAAGYLTGFPDGTFQPLAPATRAQAAKVLALAVQHRSRAGG